jgi:hypothetical protein
MSVGWGEEPWGFEDDVVTPVKIRIQNDQPSPSRVQGVVVWVYSAGGAFVTSGTTDVNGEAVVLLPDGDYDLLFYKQGVTVLPKQPQRVTVTVLQSNTFLVTVHVAALPESQNPKACKISGYIFGPDGRPSRSGNFALQMVDGVVTSGDNVILPLSHMLVSPTNTGYVEFELLRGRRYEGYFVHVEQLAGHKPPKHDIIVPDLPAFALDRLLFPVPVSVEFSETTKTISLAAGADASVTLETTYSDGSLRDKPTAWGGTVLVVEDEDVLSAVVVDGTKLQLVPKQIGVTEITFTRKITNSVSLDTLPDFVAEVLTVTVGL